MAELDRAQISARLAASREEAGLTQAEMAELLQVHFRSVQNWESPKVETVPWDRIDEWARATGRTKDWLLHGHDQIDWGAEAAADLRAIREGLEQVDRKIDVADVPGRLVAIEASIRDLRIAVDESLRR